MMAEVEREESAKSSDRRPAPAAADSSDGDTAAAPAEAPAEAPAAEASADESADAKTPATTE